jgi:MFS family permease
VAAARDTHGELQSKRFLYLYALAVSGGSVAYVPFLTILLPNQATALWEKEALSVLAQAAFVGAIAASLTNILFGWASDRAKSRRPWIATGAVLSSALLPAMQFATSPTQLFILIVCWQIGLNMMLAPLSAWAGDCVPHSQKGILGGLLSFAPALGGLSGALVTLPGLANQGERLMLVSLLVMLMVTPVLFFGHPRPIPHLVEDVVLIDQATTSNRDARHTVIRMWLARLFVQIAEASMFAFLLLWFRSVSQGFGDNDAATIFAGVLGISVVATMIIGPWSDRTDRPILPLCVCAGIAAIGLSIMAVAANLVIALAGYIVFGLASSVFLALHSSQTLRVLPAPQNRGRDLGLFNLTNTVPSLIMPWLTLALVPTFGFKALFILLAGLAIIACVMLITMPRTFEARSTVRQGAAQKSRTPQ